MPILSKQIKDLSNDPLLGGSAPSSNIVSSQSAIKSYIDSNVSSLNFIPLTGTTTGNPVTGSIEFDSTNGIFGIYGNLSNNPQKFEITDDGGIITIVEDSAEDRRSYLEVYPDSVMINSKVKSTGEGPSINITPSELDIHLITQGSDPRFRIVTNGVGNNLYETYYSDGDDWAYHAWNTVHSKIIFNDEEGFFVEYLGDDGSLDSSSIGLGIRDSKNSGVYINIAGKTPKPGNVLTYNSDGFLDWGVVASTTLAGNGLTKNVDTIELGGTLSKPTEILGDTYDFSLGTTASRFQSFNIFSNEISLNSGLSVFQLLSGGIRYRPNGAAGTTGQILVQGSSEILEWQDFVVQDGDYGDITISLSGTQYTIDNNVVTLPKIQQITTGSVLGRISSGTGNVEELDGQDLRTLSETDWNYGTLSVSAAGSTNVTFSLGDSTNYRYVTVGAGSAFYVHDLIITNTNVGQGYISKLVIDIANSTNPNINVRNLTSSGEILFNINGGESGSRYAILDLVYDGTNWRVFNLSYERTGTSHVIGSNLFSGDTTILNTFEVNDHGHSTIISYVNELKQWMVGTVYSSWEDVVIPADVSSPTTYYTIFSPSFFSQSGAQPSDSITKFLPAGVLKHGMELVIPVHGDFTAPSGDNWFRIQLGSNTIFDGSASSPAGFLDRRQTVIFRIIIVDVGLTSGSVKVLQESHTQSSYQFTSSIDTVSEQELKVEIHSDDGCTINFSKIYIAG